MAPQARPSYRLSGPPAPALTRWQRLTGALAVGALALMLVACGGRSNDVPSDTPAASGDGLEPLPGTAGQVRALRVHPPAGSAGDWCVYREWPSERLHVFSACESGTPRAHRYARAEDGELVLLEVASNSRYLVLAVYDARRNIPSGRVPGLTREGLDLVRFSRDTPDVDAQPLGAELPLGGFDNIVSLSLGIDEVVACGARNCLTLRAGMQPVAWPTQALAGYEFVEIVHDGATAHAIVRTETDGYTGATSVPGFHYAHATLTSTSAVLAPIGTDCLPWGLRAVGGSAQWRCARGVDDAAALLAHDLRRMPLAGWMDFGASNLEGRIAWSQAYYLGPLAAMAAGSWPGLMTQGQRAALGERVRREVELLARRAALPDDYTSRRYAISRSPVRFALHLGRIADTLGAAARSQVRTESLAPAQAWLHDQLRRLETTVEEDGSLSWRGRTLATLRYRRGVDFWADGVNVPYNYISGYASGLLAADAVDAVALDRAEAYLGALLAFEPVATQPTWKYWGAEGHDGWSAASGLSTRTPSYTGSPGLAHITYRSMDATALLRLHRHRPQAVPPEVVAQLAQKVQHGALLPSVNDELDRLGRAVELEADVAYRHARSAGPWELASQVWALHRWAAVAPRAGASP